VSCLAGAGSDTRFDFFFLFWTFVFFPLNFFLLTYKVDWVTSKQLSHDFETRLGKKSSWDLLSLTN
jgi:hypothetical protein